MLTKKLLSASSIVQTNTSSNIPIDNFFPKNAVYIRTLSVKDTEAVKTVLNKADLTLGKTFPRYGIFDSFNGLFDVYSDYSYAVKHYSQTGYELCWMH